MLSKYERNMRGVLRKVNNNINFNIEDNASDEVGLFPSIFQIPRKMSEVA